MDFSELILKRQSDRKYKAEPVAEDDIRKCLEAARVAPSACNSQPWKLVVINDPLKVRATAAAAISIGMNKFAEQVPVFVAVVLEKMNFTAKIGSMIKDKDFCMVDLGTAIENFSLQAAELGLGTCIMGWFDEKRIARLIHCPKGKRIPLIIALGHPDTETREKKRKTLDQMSSWNEY